MTKFKDLSTKAKILTVSSICAALMVISGFVSSLYTKYQGYRESSKIELKKTIREVLLEEDAKITANIDTIYMTLDSINHRIVGGSKFFAVGFRGNGSGDLWYRNEFGIMYNAYYSEDYGMWYYVNEEGKAVYL